MADELDQLLKELNPKSETSTETPKEETPKEKTDDELKAEEVAKKEAQLQNINKAIEEANARLKATRSTPKVAPIEEELPKIDFENPSAKAWKKEIESHVSPLQEQMQRERQEVFLTSLRSWLQDKPALASNPDRLKTIIDTYETLSKDRITGLQKDGVQLFLDKAYAAEDHERIVSLEQGRRRSQIEGAQAFADVATSHSATDYRNEAEPRRSVDPELREMEAKWDKSLEDLGYDLKAAKLK